MSTTLDAATFADALAAPESFLGIPLVAVEVRTGADADRVAALGVAEVPTVVVMLVPDAAVLPSGAPVADVLLTEDPAAPRPYVTAGPEALEATVDANPVAAVSLAMLLRTSEGLPVAAGLVAESATYSTLQSGAEFARWRASRPARAVDVDGVRTTVEPDGDVLKITLTRPARRNALDAAMRDALADAFGTALALAAAVPSTRVELRGEGPDFCAGGDLDEFGSRPDPALAHVTRLTRSPARLLHALADRTTVYLHGACLGAGVELPAFASRVVAAPDASLGLPEVTLGLVPGAGGTVSLPRRIGRRRTAYLGLSGHRLGPAEALAWGLVDAITSSDGSAEVVI